MKKYIISESQARKLGLIKEDVDNNTITTKLSDNLGISFYYEEELESYKKIAESTGSDDITLIGDIFIKWNFGFEPTNGAIESIKCDIVSIESVVQFEYWTENGGIQTANPFKLDFSQFEIVNEVTVSESGTLKPNSIDIDFKRKKITVD